MGRLVPQDLVALEGALAAVGDNPAPSMDTVAAVMLAKREIALAAIEVCDLAMEVGGRAGFEKGSPIDLHAKQNTVTVYTQSKIFPMLPEELSTGITSLNENNDRLAVVADMIVKENGDVPESTFYRAMVRNQAKLAYEDLGAWLDGSGEMPATVLETAGLKEQIELQKQAAERLRAYRQAKGALEFESIESEAVVEDGVVKGIRSVVPNAARRLIENFMVAANVEMAEFLENHNSVSLRRVVKMPRQWDGIRKIAMEFGDNLPEEPDQPALAAFLEKRKPVFKGK